jgi:hypothetical protein
MYKPLEPMKTLATPSEILSIQEKVLYLNALEKFHIYKTKRRGFLLNGIYVDLYNPVFRLLI